MFNPLAFKTNQAETGPALPATEKVSPKFVTGEKSPPMPDCQFDNQVTDIIRDQFLDVIRQKEVLRTTSDKKKRNGGKLSRQKLNDLKNAVMQDGFLQQGIFAGIKELLDRIGCVQKQSFFISILHLILDLYFSSSLPHYVSAITHFVRSVLPEALISYGLRFFDKYVVQYFTEIQDGNFFGEQFVNSVHDLFAMKAGAIKTKTWTKLCDFFNYVVCLLIGIGGNDEDSYFSNLKDMVTKPVDLGLPLLLGLFENLIYLLKQGYQAFHVKHPMSFFFTETSLVKWVEKYDSLMIDATNVNSPDPTIRIPQGKVLSGMQDLLLQAREMKSCVQGIEAKVLKEHYTKLFSKANDIHNSMTASKFRKAPLVLLINGDPSVGKTSFVNHCSTFFAKERNLDASEEGKYVRQFMDPFWSGLKTTHWFILMDDIAFEKPDKMQSLQESSMADLIQIANNVAMAPNMANLEEKGKVFCMPELVIGTTNCKHLNAQHLFQTPYAALRRFPYVISIDVKPEIKDPSTGGLNLGLINDSPEIMSSIGKDWWNIRVEKPVISREDDGRVRRQATYALVANFTKLSEFRFWMRGIIENHNNIQESIVEFHNKEFEFCNECLEEKSDCSCTHVQDGIYERCANYTTETFKNMEQFYETNLGPRARFEDFFNCYMVFSSILFILIQYFSQLYFMYAWPFSKLFYTVIVFFQWSVWGGRFNLLYVLLINVVVKLFCMLPWPFQRIILKWFSRYFGKKFIRDHRLLIGYIQGVAAIIALYKSYGVITKLMHYKKEVIDEQSIIKEEASDSESSPIAAERKEEDPQLQGGAVSVEDLYYQDIEKSVSFDYGSKITSWKALELNEVLSKVQDNVVRIHCKELKKTGCGVFIQGQVLVTNYHLFAGCNQFKVLHDMRVDLKTSWMTVPDKDIVLDVEHDLMAIRFRNMPPMRNLLELIPQNVIQDLKCAVSIITRGEDKQILNHGSKNCFWNGKATIAHEKFGSRTFEFYSAMCNSTINGDCGSPYLAHTPFGPCIVALHQNLSLNTVSGVVLTKPIVQNLIGSLSDGVQGGSLIRKGYSFSMQNWSKDSNLRRIENPHCYVFGTSQRRFPSKSHVVKSLLYDDCIKAGMEDSFSKPVMRDRQVWINQALPMVKRDFQLDIALLDDAVEMYTLETIDAIPLEDFKVVRVLNNDEALNGVKGMNYVDKIPRKTSAGFPYNCSKMKYLDFIGDQALLSSEIQEDADDIEAMLMEGIRSMAIFMGSLKDEVLAKLKALLKKTRMFTGSPLAFSLVMRKYLLTVNAFIQSHRSQFECCVGVDALGPEWNDITNFIKKFGDCNIAGDYKFYDKSMEAVLILAAGTILERICKKAGYSEQELVVVHTLIYDLAFPVMNFDGDIIMTCGSEPSGHPLTVIINSIVGSLLLRMAFISLKRNTEVSGNFKDWVRAIIYGDDNLMSSKLDSFNHTFLRDFFETQGMVYTMAEKDQDSVPFIPLQECTFLKRDFHLSSDLGTHVGRLSKKSIRKMLMYRLPKGSMDSANHAVEVMNTSCREMFFWGKDEFEAHRKWCLGLVDSLDLQDCVGPSDFQDYDIIKQWYMDKHDAHQALPLETRTFVEVQGGCIDKQVTCALCLHDDCDYLAVDSIICKRCKRCRPGRSCKVDKWFLGCLHCETNFPLRCDCCFSPAIKMQVYESDGFTTHFYCKQCFSTLGVRSSYIVLNKRSNGSFRRDPVVLSSQNTRLSGGRDEFSL